jgi:hypothetical protein
MKFYNIMLRNIFTFGFFFWVFIHQIYAQQSENSPYSRFGIGELADNNFNHIRHMGGVGTANIDQYQFNTLNPASYSFLNMYSFDIGVFAKYNSLQDSRNKSSIWTGNIDYLAFAFPLRNPVNDLYEGKKSKIKLGMAFALMPHSNVSYNILSTSKDTLTGTIDRTYVGSGGSYKFLFGNSIKYKDFSFGVNLGYLFGKIENQKNIDFMDLPWAYQNRFGTDYNISGFLWNIGAMYSKILNKKAVEKDKSKETKIMSFGIRGNSAHGFSTNANTLEYTVQEAPFNVTRDTIKNIEGIKGKGSLPGEIALGVNYYYGEKWNIGLDYQYSFWDDYFNDANAEKKGSMLNSSRIGLGGFFRPNYKSFDNFFERVYYRYGFYYQTDPRSSGGEQIEGYGVTCGLGMPFVFQRKISNVNLGVQIGQRALSLPISEKYVKISLGVTFNDDEWFLKSKYY